MLLTSPTPRRALTAALIASLAALSSLPARAQDGLNAAQQAALKQKLLQRFSEIKGAMEIRPSPIAGLQEVRMEGHVFYVDSAGDYLIEGEMLETRTRRNLTNETFEQLNKANFASQPLKDAVVWKNGSGKRKLMVFADPNCVYCKHLEQTLQKVKDVTVYTYVIPILGDDSQAKTDNILCVKDRTQAWRDWMLDGRAPAKAFGMCTSPAERNLALAKKYRVNGTPAIFFEDGSRLTSEATVEALDQRLTKASGKSGG